MSIYSIAFRSPSITDESVYKTFQSAFNAFGTVSKLYLRYGTDFGQVYFSTEEGAREAYRNLSQKNTLSMTLDPPEVKRIVTETTMEDENVETTAGIMYDTYDNPVGILENGDGQIYVPLDAIELCGFKLYPDKRAHNSNQNDNKVLENLKCYLNTQAHIFMGMNRVCINKNKVLATIDNVASSTLAASTPNQGLRSHNRNAISPKNNTARPPRGEISNGYDKSDGRSNQVLAQVQWVKNLIEVPLNVPQKMKLLTKEINVGIYYAKLISNENTLNKICYDTLTQANRGSVIQPELNQICAAKWNNIWHRAFVNKINPLELQFIDIGVIRTQETECRRLSRELCSIPNQAVRIKLSQEGIVDKLPEFAEITVVFNKQYSDGLGTYLGKLIKCSDQDRKPSLSDDFGQEENARSNISPRPYGSFTQEQRPRSSGNFNQDQRPRSQEQGFSRKNDNTNYAKPKNPALEARSFEYKPLEKQTVENKSVENKSFENKTFENKSSENKSFNNKSFEDKTFENKSSENKSFNNKSFENKSFENKSFEDKSFGKKSFEQKDPELNLIPAGSSTITTPKTMFNSKTSTPINKTVPEKIQNVTARASASTPSTSAAQPMLATNRQSIADITKGMDGIMQCVNIIDSEHFIAFLLPSDLYDDISELEKIEKEIVDEPGFTANVGETIAVQALQDGQMNWTRGVLLEKTGASYKVAAIDFGQIIETNKICRLPARFHNIVEFTVCCKCEAKVLKSIESDFEYTRLDNGKVLMKIGKDEWMATLERWNPFTSVGGTVAAQAPIVEKVQQKIVKTIPRVGKLVGIGEKVMVVSENNGILGIRSRVNNLDVKELISKLKEFEVQKLDSNPVVGQLVLCLTNDGYNRALIKAIDNQTATVELIDYGTVEVTSNDKLFYIDKFAEHAGTLNLLKLKGFETDGFSDTLKDYLKNCFKKPIFTVESINNGVVELLENTIRLSDTLRRLACPPYKRLQDMLQVEVPVNETVTLMLMHVDDISRGILKCCYNIDELLQVSELLMDSESGSMPLNLHIDEICAAKFEDDWFRAAITGIDHLNNAYDVYFIDFGNRATVALEEIREITENVMAFPALALTCVLKDILDKHNGTLSANTANELNKRLSSTGTYDAKILAKDGDMYHISIPSISSEV